MSGFYRRQFHRQIILDKVAYRSTLLGVPMSLAVLNFMGLIGGGIVVMVALVLASSQNGRIATGVLLASIGGVVVNHILMWRATVRDPHVESVWFNGVSRPATRRRVAGGWMSRNARTLGVRRRSRTLGSPPGRRYEV